MKSENEMNKKKKEVDAKNKEKEYSKNCAEEIKKEKKEIKEKEMEIMQLRNNVSELIKLSQRLEADFANYKQRVEKEYENRKILANESIIKDILDVVDSLEMAIDNSKSDDEKKGLSMIYNQLISILESYGLKKIDQLDKFDPALHTAIAFEEGEDGKIAKVFQSGFVLGNKVVRHAKVMVQKADESAKKTKNNDNE